MQSVNEFKSQGNEEYIAEIAYLKKKLSDANTEISRLRATIGERDMSIKLKNGCYKFENHGEYLVVMKKFGKCLEYVSYESILFFLSEYRRTPFGLLTTAIHENVKKELNNTLWNSSIFKLLRKLQCNNVGAVGEQWLKCVCDAVGIPNSIDGTCTKKVGGGEIGDGFIKTSSIEAKTAHLGKDGNSFQHELGKHPWHTDYVCFVDVAPHCIYLTIFPNFSEEQYKGGQKLRPQFPTRKMTWRKQGGCFKLTTTVQINNSNKGGITICIEDDTPLKEIAVFLNRTIAQ